MSILYLLFYPQCEDPLHDYRLWVLSGKEEGAYPLIGKSLGSVCFFHENNCLEPVMQLTRLFISSFITTNHAALAEQTNFFDVFGEPALFKF